MEQTALGSTDGTSQGIVDAAKILTPLFNNLIQEAKEKGITLRFKASYNSNGTVITTYGLKLYDIELNSAEQRRDLKV